VTGICGEASRAFCFHLSDGRYAAPKAWRNKAPTTNAMAAATPVSSVSKPARSVDRPKTSPFAAPTPKNPRNNIRVVSRFAVMTRQPVYAVARSGNRETTVHRGRYERRSRG
jgi:hypothetical protein